MPKPQTERLGVSALEQFFASQGWIFREQTILDYGIDALVEIVEGEYPTGKLVALQIKSGISYFKEESGDHYVFRAKSKHIEYWLGHAMPVVLVLYNPDTKSAHIKPVTEGVPVQTGSSWKILVPKENAFASPETVLQELAQLAQPPADVRRLNRLRADRKWMELLEGGKTVTLSFDDWVNKSLPRYQINLRGGPYKESWPTVYSPGKGIKEMLEHFFPWADVHVDLEAHRAGSESRWESECYQYHDSESGESYYSEEFDDWYQDPTTLAPVSDNGEVETYLLNLSLNELGEAFLLLDDYLLDPDIEETIGFSIE